MSVDWSVFDKYSESTCYCRCGCVFQSHSKIDMELRRSIARKPCPECGKNDDLRRVSSGPEIMTIRSSKEGS